MKFIVLNCVAMFAVISMFGCAPEYDEVKRVRSSDGRVEAVLVVSSVNATTSFVHEVYIVASGAAREDDNLVLRGDHFENIDLAWRRAGFLDVSYSQGRIFHSTNFWQSKNLDNYKYVVEIRLNPPADDFSLSERDRGLGQ